ncbi:MAG TPA: preprotein translocase subunit SecE [Acidobacteriota bacterium]|nr:preprotein translocase subunit SecE [Acidobacteriota bacterium]HRR56661.1 preprotein translocase subunit SecE [Acidobacteriota bacterium]HRV09641.1 preprotein translocase subunit SecE [Acidobacteriota bacterium]
MLERIRAWPNRVVTYVNEVRAELRKVTWPSKREVYSTTIVVVVSVFFFGFYLFLVDSVLQVLVRQIFRHFL